MTVEYLQEPEGLDVTTPRFSWTLESTERGAAQSAYRLLVERESGREGESGGEGVVWDSGKVGSSHTLNITYAGTDLESGGRYFWRVMVWDKEGQPSEWSEAGTFSMGLLDESEWQATWVTHPDTLVTSPLLRGEFSLKSDVKSAKVYVAGAGYYELYLNGEKVGDHVLDPAITDYRKRMLYETYDVSGQIREGENAWGFWLGNGAFRLKREEGRWTWYGMNNHYGTPMGMVQMHIIYEDDSEEIISSDETWKASASPITYNNVYGGEDYDARLEQEGWNEVGFDDASWSAAQIVEQPDVIMDAQVMPPIRVIETLETAKETQPDPGTWLFDLEQNIPGWWRIKVQGEAGTVLKIRGAETLNDALFPKVLEDGDTLSTNRIYHKEVWCTYTLKGGGEEIWEPRFFYSGFRYVEIKAEHPEQIASIEVEGQVVHSDLARNGTFKSSDTLFNQIYEATIWSQRGNLHGYPEDCPHREKGGYNGDGQVIAETSMHDFHMHGMYAKWLNDMKDSQYENGRIPNTSPLMLGGNGGGIAWGSAYILIPMWMYQYYEDRDILEEHFDSMKRYMEYLRDLAAINDDIPEEKYIINEFGGFWDSLGEWEAPVGERTCAVNPLTNTYYWYLNCLTFADIAEVLGMQDVREEYLDLAENIKQAFNEKFFFPEKDLYGIEEVYQGYLLFALNGDLVPEGHRQGVLDNLVHDIVVTSNGHLGTGILGTKHLVNFFPEEGREDILHQLVSKKTFPSWGYWMENGATTLWESWDAESSHNHQMFGTVSEYFYKYLAGIRAPSGGKTTAGYASVHIQPYIPADVDWAEASVETVRGKVSSRWEKLEDGLRMEVGIPANVAGVVNIPVGDLDGLKVMESDEVVWENGRFLENEVGVLMGRVDDGFLVFEVGSGEYGFEVSF